MIIVHTNIDNTIGNDMKKILAVAVAAAFYAGTAGAATVYSDDSSRLDILGRVKVCRCRTPHASDSPFRCIRQNRSD